MIFFFNYIFSLIFFDYIFYSWESLGNFLLKINEKNQFVSLKII